MMKLKNVLLLPLVRALSQISFKLNLTQITLAHHKETFSNHFLVYKGYYKRGPETKSFVMFEGNIPCVNWSQLGFVKR